MEHLDPNLGAIALQTVVLLIGLGIAWGSLNSTIKGHGQRLTEVEDQMKQWSKTDIAMARYEERHNSMDQRLLAQGTRLDTTTSQINSRLDAYAVLINGRLEAINNIVAGHTAQLVKGRSTQ